MFMKSAQVAEKNDIELQMMESVIVFYYSIIRDQHFYEYFVPCKWKFK